MQNPKSINFFDCEKTNKHIVNRQRVRFRATVRGDREMRARITVTVRVDVDNVSQRRQCEATTTVVGESGELGDC